MDKCMKEIGNKERKMGKEYGLPKLIVIMVIGTVIDKKAMEFISMLTAFMKENSKIFLNMEKENSNLQLEINMKGNTNKENQVGLAFILGEMEISMKDNF